MNNNGLIIEIPEEKNDLYVLVLSSVCRVFKLSCNFDSDIQTQTVIQM